MTLVYVLRIFEKRVGSVIRDCNSISSYIKIMVFHLDVNLKSNRNNYENNI
jgi:hypothetical protein